MISIMLALLAWLLPQQAVAQTAATSSQWERRLGGWTVRRFMPPDTPGVARCEAELRKPGLGMLRVARLPDDTLDIAFASDREALAEPNSRVQAVYGEMNEEFDRAEGRADGAGVVRFRAPAYGTFSILTQERYFVVGTERGTLVFSMTGSAAPLRLMRNCPARP